MPTVVTLVRCPDYTPSAVQAAVDRAVEFLGGWQQFIQPGQQALLKPNLITADPPERCSTTHPAVVEAVARRAAEHGARVSIGDSPAFGSLERVAEVSGMAAVARRCGAELIELGRSKWLKEPSPITRYGLVVDRFAHEVDVLINVPKFKAHQQALLCVAVKNLYGCVPGKRKVWRHFRAHHDVDVFSEMLVKNAAALRSTLTVVDAVVAMEGNGPRNGQPKPLRLILAGTDPIAVDTVSCALIGIDPARYAVIRAARRLGIGTANVNTIEIRGEPLEAVRDPSFMLPEALHDISFDLPRVLRSALKNLWIRRVKEPLTIYGP